MKISYVDLSVYYNKNKKKILSKIDSILQSGQYVGGVEILNFEKNITNIIKSKYCIALNSGTDALTLALHLAGIKRGDEVITASNSFVASTAVILHLGAIPIFVDIKEDQNIDENLIEKSITKKTKALLPVHLTGRPCNMEKIMKIARKYKLKVIEDCAQSILTTFKKKHVGTFGDFGCFSAHPLKNLNAFGDAGYLITNNSKLAVKARSLRTHGMLNRNDIEDFGFVSRMDNLQAGILNLKIKDLKKTVNARRKNVNLYLKFLKAKNFFFPIEKKDEFNTYHTFVCQFKKRDALKKYLEKKGIYTNIHYPIPIHFQNAYKKLNLKKVLLKNTEKQAKEILTLPIRETLKQNEIKYICSQINKFYEKK